MDYVDEVMTVTGEDIVITELAYTVDKDTPNNDIIRMRVKGFGWEVNRNNFMNKKAVLAKVVKDAFGKDIVQYSTFNGKLVDRNHIMRDNGKPDDQTIGYIESADLQDDGVYFNLIVWKRCLQDDEQDQIRNSQVTVSMELHHSDPVRIIDGVEYPVSAANRNDPAAVRSYADSAVLNGVGIAVLFKGIEPGYASAKVVETENAVLETGIANPNSTVPDEYMRGSESAVVTETITPEDIMDPAEIASVKEELAQKNDALTAAQAELAKANDALSAKVDELHRLAEELEQLRTAQWNEVVASAFDLGKLTPDTAAWLLNMLQWAGSEIGDICAKLVEVAGAVKNPGTPAVDTDTGEGAGEGAGEEDASTKPAATESAATAAAATEGATETAEVETGTPVNIASGSKTEFPGGARQWDINDL